jgi:hypothetical protein
MMLNALRADRRNAWRFLPNGQTANASLRAALINLSIEKRIRECTPAIRRFYFSLISV